MATFMDWYCKQQGISKLTPKDLEGPAFEIVKVFHHDVIHLQFQMEECHKLLTDQVDDAILRYNVSKPLPLGGEPGHAPVNLEDEGGLIYPDVGLEQLVPDQFWIEEECKYDIAAMYGISHWWFQRQRFYIDRFSSEGDRTEAVRIHCVIMWSVRIEVFSMYGYNYMKKIVLRRADLKEYVIAERDFKHMYPSDFEDLYLLNLQGHLNHLSPEDKKILTTAVNLWTRNLVIRHRVEDFQLGIESYQTQLNLTKPRWEATGFEYKHDYTVIDSPRAVTFRDRYGVQMIMRFNEIHKFSDGTLQQIDEALDYRVKEFQINSVLVFLRTLNVVEYAFAQLCLVPGKSFRRIGPFCSGVEIVQCVLIRDQSGASKRSAPTSLVSVICHPVEVKAGVVWKQMHQIPWLLPNPGLIQLKAFIILMSSSSSLSLLSLVVFHIVCWGNLDLIEAKHQQRDESSSLQTSLVPILPLLEKIDEWSDFRERCGNCCSFRVDWWRSE
ncbi:hypothetical protein Tco_0499611 [Tanacetum coccineum]